MDLERIAFRDIWSFVLGTLNVQGAQSPMLLSSCRAKSMAVLALFVVSAHAADLQHHFFNFGHWMKNGQLKPDCSGSTWGHGQNSL